MTDKLIPFRRMDRQESSDEALIAAAATGDNSATEELFRRHGDRVHRVLVRLRFVDRRDLDDLVQNTFIEIQRCAGQFDNRASVGTWIVGIAMNIVRNYVRNEKRRRAAIAAVASVSPADDGRRPDELASQRQVLARLQTVFESLPADLRIAFTLCDLEGMRGVDVARALEIPEGTVWRRLHEARTRLRVALAEDEVER
jgi:RNA polymerase sigma-70 factor (ECF subfamily)